MANAAFSSLAAQAAVSLAEHGGDIGKVLQDLGSKGACDGDADGGGYLCCGGFA